MEIERGVPGEMSLRVLSEVSPQATHLHAGN